MKKNKSALDENIDRMFSSDCPFDDDDTAAEEAHRQAQVKAEEAEYIKRTTTHRPRTRTACPPQSDTVGISEDMAYGKDDRPAVEKFHSKLKAAKNAAAGSGLEYNMCRAAVGAAQKLGHDIEMPATDDASVASKIEELESLKGEIR